ncbi:MAG: hypothetical protein ACLP9L_24305, partial [Thermoguttaceae bacterium]
MPFWSCHYGCQNGRDGAQGKSQIHPKRTHRIPEYPADSRNHSRSEYYKKGGQHQHKYQAAKD